MGAGHATREQSTCRRSGVSLHYIISSKPKTIHRTDTEFRRTAIGLAYKSPRYIWSYRAALTRHLSDDARRVGVLSLFAFVGQQLKYFCASRFE